MTNGWKMECNRKFVSGKGGGRRGGKKEQEEEQEEE